MRVGIIGSRTSVDAQHVYDFVCRLADKHPDAVVVSGGAPGVDTMAVDSADKIGLPFDVMRADWQAGKRAGKERNWRLVTTCDEVVAFWDGWSNGTAHAVTAATAIGKRAWVFAPPPSSLGIELP